MAHSNGFSTMNHNNNRGSLSVNKEDTLSVKSTTGHKNNYTNTFAQRLMQQKESSITDLITPKSIDINQSKRKSLSLLTNSKSSRKTFYNSEQTSDKKKDNQLEILDSGIFCLIKKLDLQNSNSGAN